VYPTSVEKLIVAIDGKHIVKYTPVEDSVKKEQRSLKFGPYKDTSPYQVERIMVHFAYNEPMPIFTEAKTEIIISHWGNIAVDEYLSIKNEAAKIKGEFSRADYY